MHFSAANPENVDFDERFEHPIEPFSRFWLVQFYGAPALLWIVRPLQNDELCRSVRKNLIPIGEWMQPECSTEKIFKTSFWEDD